MKFIKYFLYMVFFVSIFLPWYGVTKEFSQYSSRFNINGIATYYGLIAFILAALSFILGIFKNKFDLISILLSTLIVIYFSFNLVFSGKGSGFEAYLEIKYGLNISLASSLILSFLLMLEKFEFPENFNIFRSYKNRVIVFPNWDNETTSDLDEENLYSNNKESKNKNTLIIASIIVIVLAGSFFSYKILSESTVKEKFVTIKEKKNEHKEIIEETSNENNIKKESTVIINSGAKYVLQAGAFINETNAIKLKDILNKGGYKAVIVTKDVEENKFFNVMVGDYLSKDEGEKILLELQDKYYVKGQLHKVAN